MQHITVLSVGKIKEKFYTDAIAEYAKRFGRYCRLELTEVQDEKTPDGASAAEEELILEKEGKRLLAQIREDDQVIALAIDGKSMDSVEFSSFLSGLALETRKKRAVFVIGGSLGLSGAVLKRADAKISFSKMTFPHQLMRVILLEQIYRGWRIARGEPYHK